MAVWVRLAKLWHVCHAVEVMLRLTHCMEAEELTVEKVEGGRRKTPLSLADINCEQSLTDANNRHSMINLILKSNISNFTSKSN